MNLYEARVYGVFGSKYYDIQANSPLEAGEKARTEFEKDWGRTDGDDQLWWTENTDSVCVEDESGSVFDFATKNGMDDLVQLTPVYLLQSVVPFVEMIARLTKDGEINADGEKFILENDDAVDTIHNLINAARDLCGMEND